MAVNEFGSEFETLIALPQGAYPPAHAVAGFEDKDLAASFGETSRGRETGHARADDQNSLLAKLHLEIGCGQAGEVNGNPAESSL